MSGPADREERMRRVLDEQACRARQRFLQRRATLFLEEAAAFAGEVFGGQKAARMLREMADHLEWNT